MAKLALTIEVVVIIAILVFIFEKLRALRNETIGFVLCAGVVLGIVVVILMVTVSLASARDLGQWNMTPPAERDWYQALMQPDNPSVSCCGEADSYWADSFEVTKPELQPDGTMSKGGQYIAIITDDRPDGPLKRRHVEIGTRIVVPNYKLKYDQSNPTGHGVIFLSKTDYVYCYVAPGGV
jgi:hypothetical protein